MRHHRLRHSVLAIDGFFCCPRRRPRNHSFGVVTRSFSPNLDPKGVTVGVFDFLGTGTTLFNASCCHNGLQLGGSKISQDVYYHPRCFLSRHNRPLIGWSIHPIGAFDPFQSRPICRRQEMLRKKMEVKCID